MIYFYIMGDPLAMHQGTIQGDPLVMPMYAIIFLSLVKQLSSYAYQVWYTDDAADGCSIVEL